MGRMTTLAFLGLLVSTSACSSKPDVCPSEDSELWKKIDSCFEDCGRKGNEADRTFCGYSCFSKADKGGFTTGRLVDCHTCRTYLEAGMFPREKGLERCLKDLEEKAEESRRR